jgi:hypothetical protein
MAIQTQFSTDPNAIVTVHVSIIEAPTPINYQRTGAFVSFGATTLLPGDTELLTQLSDLTLPESAMLVLTAVWANGLVTVTIDQTIPGVVVGDTVSIVMSQMVPVGYNGTFAATIISANGFTYPLTTNPGPVTQEGIASFPSMLQLPINFSAMTWAAGVVTVTTSVPLAGPPTVGDEIDLLISGVTPAAYNGLFDCTVTGANTFTYPVTTNPGTATVMGYAVWQQTIELQQMATTYFGQGNMVGPWVLELGYQSSIDNKVIALENWLADNPLTIYGFLMPREFGSDVNALPAWPGYPTPYPAPTRFMGLLKQYQAPEKMEYFWVTVTPQTTRTLDETYKDVFKLVEAPVLSDPLAVPPGSTSGYSNVIDPEGEFTLAALFYNALSYRPSNTNRISPMAFKYVYGVTEYPQRHNGPLLVSFKSTNTNYITTGAEGGISFTMVYEGVTADHHDYFNWWYTIDWVQIEVNLNLSNAIINGSNNPLAPLYYNQDGINYLQTVLYRTMVSASTFGMVLGKIVMSTYDGPDLTNSINGGEFAGECDVNAVPFLNYTLANPGDYKIGEYDGLSTLFIPSRGFIHVLVNVVATDLVSI